MKPSSLKVIACCYSKERHVRTSAQYPDHNQDILSWEEHEEMFKTLIDMELSQDAGMPVDILIVCNGGCKGWFDKYNGLPTKNGKIIVANRDNVGGSFGAYSFAYENYDYDFYLFTEDDIFIFGEEYLKKLHELRSEKSVNFLALVGMSDDNRHPIHAHGAVGLVDRQTLESIAENGKLPYYYGNEWKRMWVIIEGEIEFTQAMIRKRIPVGYFGHKSWDSRNYVMPYYNLKCILNQK